MFGFSSSKGVKYIFVYLELHCNYVCVPSNFNVSTFSFSVYTAKYNDH